MARRSRRDIIKQPLIASNGVELETLYCRRCCQNKNPDDFLTTSDPFLDSSGKMSVCKTCINDIYDIVYESRGSVERTILELCRILNVRFDQPALSATMSQINNAEEKGKTINYPFGLYKMKINAPALHGGSTRDPWIAPSDCTFHEPTMSLLEDTIIINDIPERDLKYLEQFWGKSTKYTREDYEFLESELDEWKKTHRSDTKGELELLKELCHKSLEIRKARELGQPYGSLVKELQDLMKTANVDPAKASSANSGKMNETYGNIIRMMEETHPADYYKDRELFKDYDNIEEYFKSYVTRPLKNFVTESRDFNIENQEEDEDDIDFDIDDILNN
jgi:hypothetical protein